LLGWIAGGSGAAAGLVATSAVPATTLALFIAGLKGGLLTFGGAYTAIPYVRADTVGRGWISDGAFLDGVAIAGVLPAPLVIFGTFAGFQAGGWAGALAVTAGMFLPAFAFSMLFFERLEQLVEAPALHRLLDGIAAAVVGIIAATCGQLALATLARAPNPWPVVLIFVAGLIGAWRWKSKMATPVLLALGGVGEAVLFS
jgi:chromate transporter